MKVMLLMGGTCVKVMDTTGWYLCEGDGYYWVVPV